MSLLVPNAPRHARILDPRLWSVALVLLLAACGDSTSPDPQPYPAAWAWTTSAGVRITVRYFVPLVAPNCSTDSVWVSGPGLTGTVALDCTAAPDDAFSLDDIHYGLAPPPLPLVYHFHARIGGTTTDRADTVNCYQPLPVGLAPSPGASVTSPVTLRWLASGATGIDYAVYVNAGSPSAEPAGTVRDSDSLRLTLAPASYTWSVTAAQMGVADGTSDRACGASSDVSTFTVTGP